MHSKTRVAECEMLVIMDEDYHNQTQSSAHTSFFRLRSFELNDMGLGLNQISPITFDADAFQTSENRTTQHRAPTLTPEGRGRQPEQKEMPQQGPPPMNRTYPLNKPQGRKQHLYDADKSVSKSQPSTSTQGRFVPHNPVQPAEQHASSESEAGSQQSSNRNSPNETTIYNGLPTQVSTGTVPAPHQPSDAGTQTSTWETAPVGTAAGTQTTPIRSTQAGGTQTSPPRTPQKTTSSGGTQTSPPRSNQASKVDQGTQGQPECNQHEEDNTNQPEDSGKGSKGKKGKKKSSN